MMYHFIFGLVTISTGPLVFCSSSIIKVPKPFGASLVVKHPLIKRLVQDQINSPEIKSKKKNRNDDHQSRRPDFLEAGESDLAHFIANIREKPFNTCRRCLQPATQALIVAYRCCCFRHESLLSLLKPAIGSELLSRLFQHFWFKADSQVCKTIYYGPKILAGAEGFEPPSPVLETGSLTVELTPLFI